MREMSYQKPFSKEFAAAICNDPGAVWNVTYARTANGSEKIQHVRCDGKADPAVHGAWMLVDRVLRLLGNGRQLPETLFAPSLRSTDRLRSTMGSLQSLRSTRVRTVWRRRALSPDYLGFRYRSRCCLCCQRLLHYVECVPVSVRFSVSGESTVRGRAVVADVMIEGNKWMHKNLNDGRGGSITPGKRRRSERVWRYFRTDAMPPGANIFPLHGHGAIIA